MPVTCINTNTTNSNSSRQQQQQQQQYQQHWDLQRLRSVSVPTFLTAVKTCASFSKTVMSRCLWKAIIMTVNQSVDICDTCCTHRVLPIVATSFPGVIYRFLKLAPTNFYIASDKTHFCFPCYRTHCACLPGVLHMVWSLLQNALCLSAWCAAHGLVLRTYLEGTVG